MIKFGDYDAYFRALKNGTECQEGDYIVSTNKQQAFKSRSVKCSTITASSVRTVDYKFHLEDLKDSALLSEELESLCCK